MDRSAKPYVCSYVLLANSLSIKSTLLALMIHCTVSGKMFLKSCPIHTVNFRIPTRARLACSVLLTDSKVDGVYGGWGLTLTTSARQ